MTRFPVSSSRPNRDCRRLAGHQARSVSALVRGIDPKNHTVTVLVSPSTPDRHGTMFLGSAYAKTLPAYLAGNPVILWGHRSREGDPEDAIGRAINGTITSEGLFLTIQFAVDVNPKAETCWKMVEAGFLKAFSVGVYVLGYVDRYSPQAERDALPPHAKAALDAGAVSEVFTEVELLEVSLVLVGSNREALVKAMAAGRVTPQMVLRVMPTGQPMSDAEALEHVFFLVEMQALLARIDPTLSARQAALAAFTLWKESLQ